MRPQAGVSVSVAYVKELELELIATFTDALIFQNDYPNKIRAIECAMEPSSAVEAVAQDRRVFFRFAWWPAVNLMMFWSQHQSSVLESIDVLDHFASVDVPDLLDFLPQQIPTSYQ
jgi:hypothetical protein